MNKFHVITIGSATRDIFVRSTAFRPQKAWHGQGGAYLRFPLGAKIDVEAPFSATGGGATNAAATFRNFGLHTAYLGAVGQDESGHAIVQDLAKRGIDSRFVHTLKVPTSFSVILTTGRHGRVVLTHRTPQEFFPALYTPLKKLRAEWLYLTSLAGKMSLVRSVLATAKKRKMRIAWNPGIDELSNRHSVLHLLPRVSVLFLNREEAAYLAHANNATPAVLAKRIGMYTGGVTVITDGAFGACAYADGNLYTIHAHKDLPVTEPTGAGDAFGSGFLVGYRQGKGDIVLGLQYGIANSEAVMQKLGAKNGLLTKAPSSATLANVLVKKA